MTKLGRPSGKKSATINVAVYQEECWRCGAWYRSVNKYCTNPSCRERNRDYKSRNERFVNGIAPPDEEGTKKA